MAKIPDKFSSKAKKSETEIGKRTVDRVVRQRTFEPFDKPSVGEEFFIFKRMGDEISGILVGGPIANMRRSSSYAIKLDDGRVVEIFANKLLHRIIEKNQLLFSRIRIVYIGRQHTGYGHARKIYRVYKDKGTIRSEEYEQFAGGKKNAKK